MRFTILPEDELIFAPPARNFTLLADEPPRPVRNFTVLADGEPEIGAQAAPAAPAVRDVPAAQDVPVPARAAPRGGDLQASPPPTDNSFANQLAEQGQAFKAAGQQARAALGGLGEVVGNDPVGFAGAIGKRFTPDILASLNPAADVRGVYPSIERRNEDLEARGRAMEAEKKAVGALPSGEFPLFPGLAKAGRELSEDARAKLQELAPSVDWYTPGGLAGMMVRGAVPMVSGLATGLVTRSPAAGAAVMGTLIATPAYSDALAAGRSEEQAAQDAAFKLFSEGAPELIPFGVAMKAGTPFVKRVLANALAETPSEGVTEALDILYESGVIGNEMTLAQVGERLAQAMAGGFVMGATLDGVAHPFAARDARPINPASVLPGDAQSPIPTEIIARGRELSGIGLPGDAVPAAAPARSVRANFPIAISQGDAMQEPQARLPAPRPSPPQSAAPRPEAFEAASGPVAGAPHGQPLAAPSAFPVVSPRSAVTPIAQALRAEPRAAEGSNIVGGSDPIRGALAARVAAQEGLGAKIQAAIARGVTDAELAAIARAGVVQGNGRSVRVTLANGMAVNLAPKDWVPMLRQIVAPTDVAGDAGGQR